MGHKYVKFKTEDFVEKPENDQQRTWIVRTLVNSISRIVQTIIPNANPDFDDKIDFVKEWILEVNEADDRPTREIGLDDTGKAIAIMPWMDNYGFWTDSNVTVSDILISGIAVTKSEFEQLWRDFQTKKAVHNSC